MLYAHRTRKRRAEFSKALAGVLETPPVAQGDLPVTLVSMVSNNDVEMYLLAIKSVASELRPSKIVAIIDRDMPAGPRDALRAHIPFIEFAILEEIETAPCQRGGTWERLLYCIDRSQTEYVIQIDADTLFVGPDMHEVVACIHANRAFTMADGHGVVDFARSAELARRTNSTYMGILSERTFDRVAGAAGWRYVRGSSGFAGFARGGITRTPINAFHAKVQAETGEALWRKWGSEQCGSNFAVANSPDPVVLPHPEYASFPPHGPRSMCKFYHFIGANRYLEGFYARKCQELIKRLLGGPAQQAPAASAWPPADRRPGAFLRELTPGSALRFLGWTLGGRRWPVTLQQRAVAVHESHPPGPTFELRPGHQGGQDGGIAEEVFVRRSYFPPGWLPPETVELVVDLGANVGMSCLWWLSNYPSCRVVAFEPHPGRAAQCERNVALNGWSSRLELHRAGASSRDGLTTLTEEGPAPHTGGEAGRRLDVHTVDVFRLLGSRRIDILKIDIAGQEAVLLDDPRFGALDFGALAVRWHESQGGGKARCVGALERLGFWVIDVADAGSGGMIWAYKRDGARPPLSLAA